MGFWWFLGGALCGGAVTLVFMCCIYANQITAYEAQIRLLREKRK